MDLFNTNPLQNLLPYDGSVIYFGKILNHNIANQYLHQLLEEIPWQQDEFILFGKRMLTARKVAWIADKDYAYTYSNATKIAIPWNDTILQLKNLMEEKTKASYNSCLLNLYEDGSQGVSWHSDDEKALGETPNIASLSLGATRKFQFKHKKTKQKAEIVLEHGSLLVMKDATQANWQHAIPKTKTVSKPRISLTFRTIYE